MTRAFLLQSPSLPKVPVTCARVSFFLLAGGCSGSQFVVSLTLKGDRVQIHKSVSFSQPICILSVKLQDEFILQLFNNYRPVRNDNSTFMTKSQIL